MQRREKSKSKMKEEEEENKYFEVALKSRIEMNVYRIENCCYT